jgi:beta-glucosidase
MGKPVLGRDAASGQWRATISVTNTGKRQGAQVVQTYLTLPASANQVGANSRRGDWWALRVEMAPGETRKVSVAIDPKASHHPMSVWNEKAHAWIMPKGQYTVWVGSSSSLRDLKIAGTIQR